VVPAQRLIAALWGERLPEDASNALHQVVGRLRRQLGDDLVATGPAGYRLACDPAAVDADRFEADYRAARRLATEDPAAAAEALLDSALGLWRGPAYGEFGDGFARAPAARLEELRIAALEDRVALLLRRGDSGAETRARDLTAQEPLRERPVELLMRALHAGGRTAEALDVYRRHRELLADELGLDPAPGLRELEGALLRGAIRAPAPPPTAPRPPRRDLPWRPGPLLGRERELHLLVGCLAAQRLVTLVGPGGVGKTRLALEAAHRLAVDRQVWWADLVTVAPQRVTDALAEAAGIEVPRSADPAGSLCAALAGHRGVLCLDNAEHLLQTLAPVVERLADAAPDLAILATSRERIAVAPEHVHLLARCRSPRRTTGTTRRCGCSSTAPLGWRRRHCPTTTSASSPGCAAGSTGCRSPSSSARRGRPRSGCVSSPPASTSGSSCWPGHAARPRHATAPFAHSSIGRTACSPTTRHDSSPGSPSSRAGSPSARRRPCARAST
jgi:DNA-binding SARP family transcriptional activator